MIRLNETQQGRSLKGRRLLEDTRFNRRRRALLGLIEAIRQELKQMLIDPDDLYRLVDSVPIPVCTLRG